MPAPRDLQLRLRRAAGSWWLGVLLAAASGLRSAPLERDLGDGLTYLRAVDAAAELPPAEGPVGPLVFDLRFVDAELDPARMVSSWLERRAGARAPVFVLINPDTSTPLLRELARVQGRPGLLLVGAATRHVVPDLIVQSPAEVERRAMAAFAGGKALTELIAENPGKVRNDEASLSRDRLADASAEAASESMAPAAARPPLDAALQRAVHLHRALRALRKL